VLPDLGGNRTGDARASTATSVQTEPEAVAR